jgi:hypothetical protein
VLQNFAAHREIRSRTAAQRRLDSRSIENPLFGQFTLQQRFPNEGQIALYDLGSHG